MGITFQEYCFKAHIQIYKEYKLFNTVNIKLCKIPLCPAAANTVLIHKYLQKQQKEYESREKHKEIRRCSILLGDNSSLGKDLLLPCSLQGKVW